MNIHTLTVHGSCSPSLAVVRRVVAEVRLRAHEGGVRQGRLLFPKGIHGHRVVHTGLLLPPRTTCMYMCVCVCVCMAQSIMGTIYVRNILLTSNKNFILKYFRCRDGETRLGWRVSVLPIPAFHCTLCTCNT